MNWLGSAHTNISVCPASLFLALLFLGCSSEISFAVRKCFSLCCAFLPRLEFSGLHCCLFVKVHFPAALSGNWIIITQSFRLVNRFLTPIYLQSQKSTVQITSRRILIIPFHIFICQCSFSKKYRRSLPIRETPKAACCKSAYYTDKHISQYRQSAQIPERQVTLFYCLDGSYNPPSVPPEYTDIPMLYHKKLPGYWSKPPASKPILPSSAPNPRGNSVSKEAKTSVRFQ